MKKKLLILQLRPETQAADDEFAAFLKYGGLKSGEVHRVRMEQSSIKHVDLDDYWGVVVGGGPACVSDKFHDKPAYQQEFEADLKILLDKIFKNDFPYFGECYGLGLLIDYLGGVVSKEKYSEDVGAYEVRLSQEANNDPLTANLPENIKVMAGHKESVQSLPKSAVLLAGSSTCPIQMIRIKTNIYAVQFHAILDAKGLEVRINVYKHAGYFPSETADDLIEATRNEKITVPQKIFKRFVDRYKESH